LAFEAPGYRDDAIYTSQIYSMALGGGMSSRLFQEAREKNGLCYSIYAQAGAFAETGML
jgi:Predicted Zn-dependent peptidases